MISPSEPRPGESFTDWFNRQGIRHFAAREFTSYFETRRRGVSNCAPPREMWKLILPTLRVVDALRNELGRPCVVLSSYRCPAYNAAISGAAGKSYHMRFQALDVAVAGHTAEEVFRRLDEMRGAGIFRGGLGLYANFVHVDTRGSNATWGS